jgi:hypothetical protein
MTNTNAGQYLTLACIFWYPETARILNPVPN